MAVAGLGPMGQMYKLRREVENKNIFYKLFDSQGNEIPDANKFLKAIILGRNSHKTVASYGYDLLHFFTWLSGTEVKFEEIKEYDLYTYIEYQNNQSAAPRSINHRISTVQSFYKFCFDQEMPGGRYVHRPISFYKGQSIPGNMGILPRIKVRKKLRVKVPNEQIKPLEIQEVKNFISGIGHYRDLAITYFMLSCGLRSIEILNLKIQNISHFRQEAVIFGKGAKERKVYLPTFLIRILDKYVQYERPENLKTDYVFIGLKGQNKGEPLTRAGLREIFRYKRKKTGVGRANPHRFRHTCGADLVRAGVSLRVIQQLFGHENINETARYTNLFQADIKAEVFRAYENIKGRYGQKA